MGNWTKSKLFGCNLMSVKVFVEVVTALLLNASNVGLSVALLFKLNNWLAVQNLRIALKKAVFALGFKKPSVITL